MFSFVDPDPGSGAFLTPVSGIWDVKISGSGMNIPDNFSESLGTVLGSKILKFFDADPDPGSGIFLTLDLGSEMEKLESGIQDPAHVIEQFRKSRWGSLHPPPHMCK
jgi:hypothetical protein